MSQRTVVFTSLKTVILILVSPGGDTGPPLGDCRPAGGGRPNSAGGEKSFVKVKLNPKSRLSFLPQKVEKVKGEGGNLVVVLASKGSPALRGLCR